MAEERCGMCEQQQERHSRADRPGLWHVCFSRSRNWVPCYLSPEAVRSYYDYYDGEWRAIV